MVDGTVRGISVQHETEKGFAVQHDSVQHERLFLYRFFFGQVVFGGKIPPSVPLPRGLGGAWVFDVYW